MQELNGVDVEFVGKRESVIPCHAMRAGAAQRWKVWHYHVCKLNCALVLTDLPYGVYIIVYSVIRPRHTIWAINNATVTIKGDMLSLRLLLRLAESLTMFLLESIVTWPVLHIIPLPTVLCLASNN